jgi:hypothetical protein
LSVVRRGYTLLFLLLRIHSFRLGVSDRRCLSRLFDLHRQICVPHALLLLLLLLGGHSKPFYKNNCCIFYPDGPSTLSISVTRE